MFELVDPLTDRRVRLSELAYSVAWMMDGRDLRALSDWAWRDLHMDVPVEKLARFARRLSRHGWLEESAPPPPAASPPPAMLDTFPETALTTRALTASELDQLLPAAGLPRSPVHPRVRRPRPPTAAPAPAAAPPRPDQAAAFDPRASALVTAIR